MKMQKRISHEYLLHKPQFNNHSMSGQRVLHCSHGRARLEDKRQRELIGQYSPLEDSTVKTERLLGAIAVGVRPDQGIVHEPVRLWNSVEQPAGMAESAISVTSGEGAVGGDELGGDGRHVREAVDD